VLQGNFVFLKRCAKLIKRAGKKKLKGESLKQKGEGLTVGKPQKSFAFHLSAFLYKSFRLLPQSGSLS
jgi:hypothetical protein